MPIGTMLNLTPLLMLARMRMSSVNEPFPTNETSSHGRRVNLMIRVDLTTILISWDMASFHESVVLCQSLTLICAISNVFVEIFNEGHIFSLWPQEKTGFHILIDLLKLEKAININYLLSWTRDECPTI